MTAKKCWCATYTGRQGTMEFVIEKLAVAINMSDTIGQWPVLCRLLDVIDMLVRLQGQNPNVKICDPEFMTTLTKFIRQAGADSGFKTEERPRLN